MTTQNEDLQSPEDKSTRPLLYYFCLASTAGLGLFFILIYAAWVNLRTDFPGQRAARYRVAYVYGAAKDYSEKLGNLPSNLNEIIQTDDSERNVHSYLYEDLWGSKIQYKIDEAGHIVVYSFGRDGKLGGTGLDAEIYHDGRNYEKTLPSFFEFYEHGLWTSSIVGDGGVFCFVVSLGLFGFLYRTGSGLRQSSRHLWSIFSAIIIIGLAAVFGAMLLPLHVPNGH